MTLSYMNLRTSSCFCTSQCRHYGILAVKVANCQFCQIIYCKIGDTLYIDACEQDAPPPPPPPPPPLPLPLQNETKADLIQQVDKKLTLIPLVFILLRMWGTLEFILTESLRTNCNHGNIATDSLVTLRFLQVSMSYVRS